MAAEVKRYYRKRVELFLLIDRIKLWTSRSGTIHGLKSIDRTGDIIRVSTHCGRDFTVRNSRNSRAARYLRNKYYKKICPECGIPEWKLAKFSATRFSRRFGSSLLKD
ncbi:MAG: pyrrolysine--tRNA(Pyl) ligase small subunit [Thermodesulfobacteriota bacterium]